MTLVRLERDYTCIAYTCIVDRILISDSSVDGGRAGSAVERDGAMALDATQKEPTKTNIVRAGYRLLLSRGIKATTYAALAEASGCSRALVQYHIPVKARLATELVIDLVAGIEVQIKNLELSGLELTAYRFMVVQTYYAFLLDPRIRPFTVDLLSDRAILTAAMAEEIEWNSRILGLDDAADRSVVDRAVVALGGTHELLYWQLTRGEPSNAKELAESVLLGSVAGTDADVAALQRLFAERALSAETLEAAVDALNTSLTQD